RPVCASVPSLSLPVVVLLLFLNGIAAGLFIVPMNALLQHRGAELVNAGQAIAVQNFCENLSVMTMLCAYALMRATEVPLVLIVVALGVFTSASMAAIRSHSAARDPDGAATTAAGPRQ